MIVGRHTGFNYDRMAQDMRHPQGVNWREKLTP
jgi:hypothetical protein